MKAAEKYQRVRRHTLKICEHLQPEDMVAQAETFTSPAKWHLAHSTWFFETFVLKPRVKDYQVFNPDFHFLFNSYYESLGERVSRNKRGLLSRPLMEEVYAYRTYVDEQMLPVLDQMEDTDETIELGLQHEQQHQELLVTDTKYMFSQNPLLPAWKPDLPYTIEPPQQDIEWLSVKEGVYEIGHQGKGFCFDNELGVHKQYLRNFLMASRPVTNREYMEFVNQDAYGEFSFWLSEGWDWLARSGSKAPLYWMKKENTWYSFGFNGLEKIDPALPVMHLNYYEAEAFARWKGLRLPTEFEHETAARLYPRFFTPCVWEWTQSAYLPYPGFKTASGAVGEYNGKFMVNQMVLRGASVATPEGHTRVTYRNFFDPELQWQFSGIRLVKDLE